ncbi:MAG: TetR/AcrR family transcriptional regulator [Parasporobacterium sp.]|nr:TetR/AcrR family transcriptional regulator [Parasporobacterium sp.]
MQSYTKMVIRETFLQLLEQKPLHQITVKMVVEKCGINRNSFYYHYQDMPDLVEDIVMTEADRIIEENPSVLSDSRALNAVARFISDKRRAILHIYNSVNRDIFERYLWKVCDHVVSSYESHFLEGKPVSEFDRGILKRTFKCFCFGVAIEWLDSDMEPDVQKEIDRFCSLYQGLLDEMINRCIQK